MNNQFFVNEGDRYGGKNRGTQYGGRLISKKVSSKVAQTPIIIALGNLEKSIDSRNKNTRSVAEFFNQNNWYIFRDILSNYDLLRFRNAPILREVLGYLDNYYVPEYLVKMYIDNGQPDPRISIATNYHITVAPYIQLLMTTESGSNPTSSAIEYIKLLTEFTAYRDTITPLLAAYDARPEKLIFVPRSVPFIQ